MNDDNILRGNQKSNLKKICTDLSENITKEKVKGFSKDEIDVYKDLKRDMEHIIDKLDRLENLQNSNIKKFGQ